MLLNAAAARRLRSGAVSSGGARALGTERAEPRLQPECCRGGTGEEPPGREERLVPSAAGEKGKGRPGRAEWDHREAGGWGREGGRGGRAVAHRRRGGGG